MSGWPFRSKDPQIVLWSHFSKRWIFSGEGNICCSVGIRLLLSWSLKSLFNRQESGEFLIPMFSAEVLILLLAFCSSPNTMEQDVDNDCTEKDALGFNKLWISSLQCLVSAFKTMTKLTCSRLSPSSAVSLVFLKLHGGRLGQRAGWKCNNDPPLQRRWEVMCWCGIVF